MKKNVLINLRVEQDLKDAFQQIAEKNGYTMSELLTASMHDVTKRGYIPLYLVSKLQKKNRSIISIQEIKACVEATILKTELKDKINKISIFGSYATGQMKKSSDIDLLINVNKTFGLFDLGNLSSSLEKELGKKVDITIDGNLDPYFKAIILREQIVVYEKH